MSIKIARAGNLQPPLFDQPRSGKFKSAGAARSHVGNLVEEIVVDAMGLRAIPTVATHDVCFDAELGLQHFEIKSLRRANKSPIYVWRVEKERAADSCAIYLFAVHEGKNFESFEDAYKKLSKTLRFVYAVTLDDLEQMMLTLPLCKIENMERKGYEDGYKNVPWLSIRSWAQDFSGLFRCLHAGHRFAFSLYASEEAKARIAAAYTLGYL